MSELDSLKFPIEIALKEIEKQREKIRNFEKDDVEACKLYMEMAKTAINGLVNEAQNILLHARKVDIKNKQEIDLLYDRIDKYLYTDNLRPALNESISGLKGISDAMTNHAKRFMQWPWVKKNRQNSIENFENLLSFLTEYLQKLQNNFLPGGSGMLAKDLYSIRSILVDIRENKIKGDELMFFIEESEMDRSNIYKEYLKLNGEITETFEKMRIAIR